MLTGEYSDKGPYREKNEDSVKCTVSGDHAFLVIADGLGGAPFGEIASKTACEEATKILSEGWNGDLDGSGREEFLLRLFNTVNGKLLRRCVDEPKYTGMCTTLTVAVLADGYVSIGHVGDSRAYLVTEDELICISKDHNRARILLESGQITEEEAKRHPLRNLLTMVVGENMYLSPYVDEVKVKDGDCVILLTDGVYSAVSDDDITDIRNHKGAPSEFCRILVEKAVDQGSMDNSTAAVGIVRGKEKESVGRSN